MRSPCVVVGAGPAGLAVSRGLADAGVDHVVLERNDVADTWQSQRWDSFRLNTPGWMNSTLGPVDRDSFSSRDEVVRLLADRADTLPVRRHSPVESVESDGSSFIVRTPSEQIHATTVVLASGLQNVPKMPSWTDQFASRLQHLHTADYTNATRLHEGAVLVVGSGQSGCQIAEDLALAGRRVYLSTSRVGRYPWMHRGRELIGWLVDCGHWDQRPEDLADPAETRAAIAVVGSGGRSLDLRALEQLGVALVGRITHARGEHVGFDQSVAGNIAYADTVAAALTAKADTYIAAHSIDAPGGEPDATGAPRASATITDLDLAAANVSSVIWCTGFTGDLSYAPTPILDDHAMPRHNGCASPIPGMWFVGFPWLTRRRSGILHGIPTDADAIVDGVLHHLAHPT
jgi:putative flavoprotein involved in K+ transport